MLFKVSETLKKLQEEASKFKDLTTKLQIFGKDKKADTSQDQQIAEIWKWIEYLNKNQAILIKNNDVVIQNEKNQETVNQQLIDAVNRLQAKDKQHDAKDQEHDTLIENLKKLGKALETATSSDVHTEGDKKHGATSPTT